MIELIRTSLWQQLGAALDMLENAIIACPDDLWLSGANRKTFWYLAFHTLYWLESDLSPSPEAFAPVAPFNTPNPKKPFSKAQLLAYLEQNRVRCRERMRGLTESNLQERFVAQGMDFSILEMLLYGLRHVQHHAAQLNLLLRQHTESAPKWVRRTKHPLEPKKSRLKT